MGYERSALIALVSTLLLILLVDAQGVMPIELPVKSRLCAGSTCKIDACASKELTCCQCTPYKVTLFGKSEQCACCPQDYWCVPNTSTLFGLTKCCPAGWGYDKLTERCTRLTASIPSTVVSSQCDRMYLSIFCDDVINDLFLDGVLYKHWGVGIQTIEIPANTKVIATNCSDVGRIIAGVIASTTNDYLLTSTAWKCTSRTNLPANWMQTTFDDYTPPNAWPNAVFEDFNVATNIHGYLSPISPSAAHIWTKNYRRSLIDTPVYCRGYFPTANCDSVNSGCNLAYGNCTNLCSRGRTGTCCGCELNSFGPFMVCNCCPQGYQCCGKSRCCPVNSTCQLDGQCLEVFSPVSAVVNERGCFSIVDFQPPK